MPIDRQRAAASPFLKPPTSRRSLDGSHGDRSAGLRLIRLHDLRHFAATLHLAVGVDIKIVQDLLGHSSRAITSDTYTTVLPDVARAAAEAAAALIPAS